MDFHDSSQVFFEKKNKATARRSFAAFSVVTMAVGIGLGILIGRYAICDEKSNSEDSGQLSYNKEADPSWFFFGMTVCKRCSEHLK